VYKDDYRLKEGEKKLNGRICRSELADRNTRE